MLVLIWVTLVFALRELIETVEHNTQLLKQVSDLTGHNQQQVSSKMGVCSSLIILGLSI